MSQAPWPADALEVGRIGEPWGLKGWFHVHPYATPADALRVARTWHLEAAAPAVAARPLQPIVIRAVRAHGSGLVASADGIDGRDAAVAFRGARIYIGRSAFPPAGDDEFYWADLIGLAVVNRSGDALGEIAGLVENGPQTVLRVKARHAEADGDGVERLIPFVSAHVDSVDLAGRRIVVDWGLDY